LEGAEGLKLLLDTHAWLWYLLEPERLSRRAALALESPDAELYLSPLSVWETLLLAEKGRIALDPEPITWCRDALRTAPLVAAELTHEVAIRSRQLDGFRGRDPIDRFLVATCLVAEMTLVTRDASIRRYRGIRTLW
jgi:PIN domain nuclease of toxin-antitoxin system